MKEAPWRSKLPLDVQWSLKDSPHRPVAEFLAAPRELRRNALMTIQREMKQTPKDIKDNIRLLGDLMFDYDRLRGLMAHHLSPSKRKAWHKSVASSSSRLIDRLSDPKAISQRLPDIVNAPDGLFDALRLVRANANAQIAAIDLLRDVVPNTKPPDLATKRLIINLGHWYQRTTGTRAAYSRSNYHYNPASPKHGKPTGPFFRLVAAVLELLQTPMSPEALASAIDRRYDLGEFQPPDPRTLSVAQKTRKKHRNHT